MDEPTTIVLLAAITKPGDMELSIVHFYSSRITHNDFFENTLAGLEGCSVHSSLIALASIGYRAAITLNQPRDRTTVVLYKESK